MTLTQLRAFAAVATAESFSEAALELRVSQASVSQAVADLERDLRVSLFERGYFGARLTETGARLARYARRMLQLEAALKQEAALANNTLAGVLRVATFQSVSKKLLPNLITTLQKRYPELTLRLVETSSDSSTNTTALREGRAEVGFTSLPVSKHLISWELFRDPYLVVVPATYAGELTWRDLSAKPLIAFEGFEDDGCTLGTRYFRNAYGPLEPAFEVTEISTIVSMIVQGLGFTILPSYTVEPLPRGVSTLPLELPFERVLSVAVTPDGLKTPAVRAFLTALREIFPDSRVPSFDPRPNASPPAPST